MFKASGRSEGTSADTDAPWPAVGPPTRRGPRPRPGRPADRVGRRSPTGSLRPSPAPRTSGNNGRSTEARHSPPRHSCGPPSGAAAAAAPGVSASVADRADSQAIQRRSEALTHKPSVPSPRPVRFRAAGGPRTRAQSAPWPVTVSMATPFASMPFPDRLWRREQAYNRSPLTYPIGRNREDHRGNRRLGKIGKGKIRTLQHNRSGYLDRSYKNNRGWVVSGIPMVRVRRPPSPPWAHEENGRWSRPTPPNGS